MSGGNRKELERRGFLRTVALGSVAGAAGAVVGGAVPKAEAAESPAEQLKARYRETPHVKRYYFLNRL